MINLKKLTITTVAMTLLVGTFVQTASAAISYPDGGTWNRGLEKGNWGYYMAYSYYYHGTRSHYSWAELNGHKTANVKAGPGGTSIANSESYKSQSWDAGYGF